MTAAEKLRAIRESLPGSPGVRAIATALGYEKHNAYGYYESADFKKDALPLDKARLFAAAFAKFGGDPCDVLRLAGLSDDEIAREPAADEGDAPAVQFVKMAVALPNADILATMMRALLKGVGLETAAAAHAETLARRLPSALEQAVADLAPEAFSPQTIHAAPARPRAKRRRD